MQNYSTLSCSVDKKSDILFFSLIDYQNSLFVSSQLQNILLFYNNFADRDSLVNWMRKRPKGRTKIIEVEGIKDAIVVIPTSSFEGKYAKMCKDEIFRGLHIIFVESGEAPDPYFNYSHNINIGIKYALKYNPKWIIISNDDMYKIDDISTLLRCLKETPIDSDIIFAKKNGDFRSYITKVVSFNYFGRFVKKLSLKVKPREFRFFISSMILLARYNINILSGFTGTSPRSLFLRKMNDFMNVNNFAIFNARFVIEQGGMLFDEIFINGYEDLDLSIRIFVTKLKIDFVDYRIGAFQGKSLGISQLRSLRDIANLAYFNSKYPNLHDII